MVAGVRVTNDWGTVQIDENYQMILLRARGSVAISSSNNGQGFLGSLQVAATSPLLFFGPNANHIGVLSRTLSGGVWTYTLWASAATTVSYYVFDEGVPASSGRVGLQLFKPNGQLGFDSSNKPLRITSVLQIRNDAMLIPQDFTLPTNGSFACCLSFVRMSAVMFATQPVSLGARLVDTLRFTNGAAQVWGRPYSVFPMTIDQAFAPQTTYPPQILVADVSNF